VLLAAMCLLFWWQRSKKRSEKTDMRSAPAVELAADGGTGLHEKESAQGGRAELEGEHHQPMELAGSTPFVVPHR
jgi:hypothetical protein